MSEFPLTFTTVQQGTELSRVVNDRDELIALRSELELLNLSRAGQARLVCVALSNATSFESVEGHADLHELMVDALHPCVVESIEAIDRAFPDVRDEVCHDVLQDEVESFQNDVIVCLSGSTSPKFHELSKTYALSVGLDPQDLQEASALLDRSETTMNENANAPSPSNEDQTDATIPPASEVLEESSGDELAEFDNVEDALNAMESDLEELQALAGEDGFTEVENTDESVTEATAEVPDAVEPEAAVTDDATLDDMQSALDTASEVLPSIDETVVASESDVVTDSQPAEATEPPAMVESTPGEAVSEAPTTKVEEPATALDGLAEEMSSNPVAAGILASFGADAAKAEAPKKPTAEELRAELDQALLEDSVASFTEAVGGLDDETPVPQAAQPSPASPRPTEQSFASRSSVRQDRSSRPARPRRSASNHQSRTAESAIENFAGFLVDEVNSLWTEAREGLDEICAFRDEIESIRNEIRRTHQETIGMRDAAYTARKEARHLQSQIQNQRDDANRARQRTDAAAVDAQAASDRAAAAAREAESMATMSQPM